MLVMKFIMKFIISSYLLINCKLKRANKSISSFLLLSFKISDRVIKKYFNVVGGLLFQIHEQQTEKTGIKDPDIVLSNERVLYINKILEECGVEPYDWDWYFRTFSDALALIEELCNYSIDETDPELYEQVREWFLSTKITREEDPLREAVIEEIIDEVLREAAVEEALRKAAEEDALREAVAEEALRKAAEEDALREAVIEEIIDEVLREAAVEEALRKAAEEEALRKQVEEAELTQEIPLNEEINPNLDSVLEMIDFDNMLEAENGFIVNEELRQFFEICISISQKSLIHGEYFTILIYLLFAILLSFVILGFSYLFVVQNPETEKMSAYECGFEPYEDARQKFDVKFYIVAMLFIIFDIETMYLIPWCVSLPYINSVGYFVMMEFILELCVGFLYVWYIGGLEWD